MNFLREKFMLIPTLSYMLHIYFISIITNVDFADILLMDGDVTQNDLKKLSRLGKIYMLFLPYKIKNMYSQLVLKKLTKAFGFER